MTLICSPNFFFVAKKLNTSKKLTFNPESAFLIVLKHGGSFKTQTKSKLLSKAACSWTARIASV